MKEQKNNSKLIFALSMLWGFLLIFAQFAYYMGSTDGFANVMDAMISYIPTSVAILILTWTAGRSLNKMQLNINPTKRQFILIAILCLFFFPIGLFFLFVHACWLFLSPAMYCSVSSLRRGDIWNTVMSAARPSDTSRQPGV